MKVDPLGRNGGFWFRACFRAGVLVYRWFIAPFARDRWRPYDPAWLLGLAQQQWPEKIRLHQALSACTRASGDVPYLHFVSARRANQAGAEWQFERNLHLEHPAYGDLVLDILKDGRVGGVEFLGLLLADGHRADADLRPAQQAVAPAAR